MGASSPTSENKDGVPDICRTQNTNSFDYLRIKGLKKENEEIGRWLALRAGELFAMPFDARYVNEWKGGKGSGRKKKK